MKKKEPVLVSACLVGIKSRYNGKNSLRRRLIQRLKKHLLIPVCPEQLGGLPTPRPKAEIVGGDGKDVLEKNAAVFDEKGRDVTGNFKKGAKEVLKIARLTGSTRAFLKEKSPSCGVTMIVSGEGKIPGIGVTAAFLKKKGLDIEGVD